jgi:alkaline phosphatase
MKRRDFLAGTAFAGLSTMVVSPFGEAQIVRPDRGIRRARNVIFFVYDGFGWEDFAVAQHYAHRHQGRTLALERLFALGGSGSMMSHSLTSVVTDSAAAATAWGTGRRTANANIGVFPDGRRLTTVLELARAADRATGLITTTRVTHATPAGFAAHVINRSEEDEIAVQYLELLPDVVLGGGARHFDPDARSDGRDLFGEFARKGYAIARTDNDLDRLNGSKVLGTFTASHLPYEIDRVFQGAGGPSLAEMTRKGLQLLSGGRNGFVAQVEAGRIDHANHSNDPGTMLWDVLAADETLEVIMNFADRNPDTLVIMASDHGTGGAAIYGIGRDYHRSSPAFDLIASRKASYDFVLGQLGRSPQASRVREVALELLGVTLGEEEAGMVVDAIKGDPRIGHPTAYHQQPDNSLAWVVAAGESYWEPDHLNVHYVAGQHTAGPVPIALYGAGTSEARLGLVDITEAFGWITDAIGVRHENPVMSEEEALVLAVLADPLTATGTG